MGRLALGTCWYTRQHVPNFLPRHREDGAYRGECRFCGSRIHSHDKRQWAVTGDLDLDELGGESEFIAVIDREDGMVIARVPLEAGLPKAALKEKLKELREHYLTEPSEADFAFVVHRREIRRAAAH